jgi:hypothetical protein
VFFYRETVLDLDNLKLRDFKITQFTKLKIETIIFPKRAKMFPRGNKSKRTMRRRWQKSTAGRLRGRAVADQLPACVRVDFNWTAFYIHIS